MKKILILIINITFLVVTGCSRFIPAYKIDVQQGNILLKEDVDQIRPGMDQKKVSYILGTPAIKDPFHPHRWDYIYTLKKGNGKYEEKNITVYFEKNKLVRTEGSVRPDPTTAKSPDKYKKSAVMTVNPVIRGKPGWLKRIWISFFGSEEDLESLD